MRRIFILLLLAFFLAAAVLLVWQRQKPKVLSSSQNQTAATQAVLAVEGKNLYLSENGLVLDKSASSKPPLFLLKDTKLTPGQKVEDRQILFAVSLAEQLSKSDFSVAGVRLLESGDVAVYSPGDSIALFSENKDQSMQVDSLQRVLAKAKIDATKITKIDLRFDKPVITFK